MSKGKYPFEDTPDTGGDFTKVSEDDIEHPKKETEEQQAEEVNNAIDDKESDAPEELHPVFKPPWVIDDISIPANAHGTWDSQQEDTPDVFSETEKTYSSESEHKAEDNNFTDNPIKINVDLEKDWGAAVWEPDSPEEGDDE